VPLPAGSPVNVAVGLGRSRVAVDFAGPLSIDGFGQLLVERLVSAGVGIDDAPRTDAPTTLAVVHLDAQRRATYGFYLSGTSAAVPVDAVTLADGSALHVSFGAVGPTSDPAGLALVDLLRREAGRRVVTLDPNVRRVADEDRPSTVAAIEDAVAACDLVKVSDEDLATLHPGEDPAAVAERWVALGPAVVVVTLGPEGALARGVAGDVAVPGRRVAVVDTVGAGDAFTSGLLASLHRSGHLDRSALRRLDSQALLAAMDVAVEVSAITCTREGADPPTRDELTTLRG
jgi:fructokinase